ncbi:hypothetical protein [Streptomyces sp. NBC_01237]|uniref:hypothetical protein n=1 Tax=Streptomyces sp. NBC_01237 TaxID=2903790 RepID=UPI002DD95B80|nr:hypothetical protein [Streptomyces sp. NBC_01237]WRZ77291.1 hypothetical protein OG251_37185 [Streptomyces sp. NBC_01237]
MLPYTFFELDTKALAGLPADVRQARLATLGAEATAEVTAARGRIVAQEVEVLARQHGRHGAQVRASRRFRRSPQWVDQMLATAGRDSADRPDEQPLYRIDWERLAAVERPWARLAQLAETGRRAVAAAKTERGRMVAWAASLEGNERGAQARSAERLGLKPARFSQLHAEHEAIFGLQRVPERYTVALISPWEGSSGEVRTGRLIERTRLHDRLPAEVITWLDGDPEFDAVLRILPDHGLLEEYARTGRTPTYRVDPVKTVSDDEHVVATTDVLLREPHPLNPPDPDDSTHIPAPGGQYIPGFDGTLGDAVAVLAPRYAATVGVPLAEASQRVRHYLSGAYMVRNNAPDSTLVDARSARRDYVEAIKATGRDRY